MLVAILNTCAQDDDDESPEVLPDEIEGQTKALSLEEQQKKDLEAERRKEIIRNKIRAVGKVKFFIKNLTSYDLESFYLEEHKVQHFLTLNDLEMTFELTFELRWREYFQLFVKNQKWL